MPSNPCLHICEPDAHSTKRMKYSAPIVSVMCSVVLSYLHNYTIVTMKYKCKPESEYILITEGT